MTAGWPCKHCGTRFDLKTTNHEYCSPACRRAAYVARRRAQRKKSKWVRKRKDGSLHRMEPSCRNCNNPIPTNQRSDVRYCSPTCRQAAYRERLKQSKS